MFVFAVPVRQGGEIIGAIIGTRNLTDILSVLSFQDEIAQYNFSLQRRRKGCFGSVRRRFGCERRRNARQVF
ncbi:MAG: hypothetical protein L6V93_09250 [Clostridiales bacterium]|nr:MAG: hypothetical protein L6V93_09250 [Clostridiales bacterium]